jgi:Tfp pilus assembly protein PilX
VPTLFERFNNLIRRPPHHRGAALILALILLALGGLMVVPLLNYVGGGFKNTSQVYTSSTDELYSADAAVREAMWQIQHNAVWLPDVGQTSATQNIATLNGKNGNYTVTRLNDSVYTAVAYRIDAHGVTPGNSHTTSITVDVSCIKFNSFTDNALTSPSSITTKQNDLIQGDVQSPVVDGHSDGTMNATINPPWTVNNSTVIGWPTITALNNPIARYYSHDVANAPLLSGSTIDLSVPADQGPLKASGAGTYNIQGSGTLHGTLYIDGDLDSPNGSSIDLSGHTIFVTGNVNIWPSSEINGPGSIIAMGSINFQPNHTNNQFIYLMSIQGTINFQPNSSFVGSIAGNATIDLQPNNTISWVTPPGSLNLPGFTDTGIGTIENWKVH